MTKRDRYRAVELLCRTWRAWHQAAEYIAGSGNTLNRPVKVPVPGPFTLAGCIDGASVYADSLGRDQLS